MLCINCFQESHKQLTMVTVSMVRFTHIYPYHIQTLLLTNSQGTSNFCHCVIDQYACNLTLFQHQATNFCQFLAIYFYGHAELVLTCYLAVSMLHALL